MSLHAGVDAAFEEYEGLIKALKEMQSDKSSGSIATGLLKKINNYEFLETLYLLKHMVPNLSALSKTFQTGSLNFSRIIPSINKCKAKIQKVEKDDRVLNDLKVDLDGRLKPLNIELKEFQETRIQQFVQKYTTSICANIDARFPANSCKVLEAFSIFDVYLFPSSSSPIFNVYGTEEISCLGKQFFPDESMESILTQWKDFKLPSLKKQLSANKLNFKKTSTEWALEHIVNAYKEEVDFLIIVEFAKIASIVPVTNAWPERGASAVKRVKSRTRSTMKNDLLNALLHISINGPPSGSTEANNLINRVVDKFVEPRHNKIPQKYVRKTTESTTICTQTESIIDVNNVVEDKDDELDIMINSINDCDDKLTTNFEEDFSSSDDDDDDNEYESLTE